MSLLTNLVDRGIQRAEDTIAGPSLKIFLSLRATLAF